VISSDAAGAMFSLGAEAVANVSTVLAAAPTPARLSAATPIGIKNFLVIIYLAFLQHPVYNLIMNRITFQETMQIIYC
jgi:hypothetical protein